MFYDNPFFYYENLGFEKNLFCLLLAEDKLWDDYTMAWMTVY